MTNESTALHTHNLCKPFFDASGLNAFSYSRVFNNGSRSELWSDAGAFKHTFKKARYIVGAYTPQFFSRQERYSFLQKKVETYPRELRESYTKQLIDQRELFDHDNCFMIINKKEALVEYFIFYASRENGMAINFYLNGFDKLETFSRYFVNAAKELIAFADNNKIEARISYFNKDEKNERSALEALTSREKDVAKLLVTGATIKDVGVALRISPRTVECHVENMKSKLSCTRKSALVKKLCSERTLFF